MAEVDVISISSESDESSGDYDDDDRNMGCLSPNLQV